MKYVTIKPYALEKDTCAVRIRVFCAGILVFSEYETRHYSKNESTFFEYQFPIDPYFFDRINSFMKFLSTVIDEMPAGWAHGPNGFMCPECLKELDEKSHLRKD